MRTTIRSADLDSGDSLLLRLRKDLRDAAGTLTAGQARYFVDTYYILQGVRISARNEQRASGASEEPEPASLLEWLGDNFARLEAAIKSTLDTYGDEHREGRWAKSVVGIGPVLAAGLLAHIDIEKAKSAGSLWRFAGLDPTVKWAKGQKRPWNERLKLLCWKIGESFVKTSGHAQSFYGPLWAEYKQRLIERNERDEFASRAAQILTEKKFRKDTIARSKYEAGQFPDGHLHAMSKRWVVKLFLSHYHQVAWACRGVEAPKPYVISILGHGDLIAPPGWPCE